MFYYLRSRSAHLTLSQKNIDEDNIGFYNVKINLASSFENTLKGPYPLDETYKDKRDWPISFRDDDFLLVLYVK